MRWNKDVACSTYSAKFSLIWSTVSLPPLLSRASFLLAPIFISFAMQIVLPPCKAALCTTTVCTHPTDQAPQHQIVLLQVGVLVICTWTLSYCIGGVHIYSVCIYCSLPALSYYPHINQCAHYLKDMWTRYLPILCFTRVYFHPNVRCVCVSVCLTGLEGRGQEVIVMDLISPLKRSRHNSDLCCCLCMFS